MESYRYAVSVGISPVEFWGLTPFLTRHAMTALSDGRTTQAWIIANLSRTKKMPKLETLLSRSGPDHKEMESRMKTALKNLGRK